MIVVESYTDKLDVEKIEDNILDTGFFKVSGEFDGNTFFYSEEYEHTNPSTGYKGFVGKAKLRIHLDEFLCFEMEENGQHIDAVREELVRYDEEEQVPDIVKMSDTRGMWANYAPDSDDEAWTTDRGQQHEQEMYASGNEVYKGVKQAISDEVWYWMREEAVNGLVSDEEVNRSDPLVLANPEYDPE